MSQPAENSAVEATDKKDELKAFLFICVFLFPIIAVALVGTYGFAIWISQILWGH